MSHDWHWALDLVHGLTFLAGGFSVALRIRLEALPASEDILCQRCGKLTLDSKASRALCCVAP